MTRTKTRATPVEHARRRHARAPRTPYPWRRACARLKCPYLDIPSGISPRSLALSSPGLSHSAVPGRLLVDPVVVLAVPVSFLTDVNRQHAGEVAVGGGIVQASQTYRTHGFRSSNKGMEPQPRLCDEVKFTSGARRSDKILIKIDC